MSNIETIAGIYQAFGKGDVPAILEHLAPDVVWEYGGTSEVPWLTPRQGREGAGAFFRVVFELLDIQKLDMKHLLGDASVVVALMDLEAVVKPTGKRLVELDEVHIWHFDAQGRVVRFRHRADTQQHIAAYRG